MFPLELTIDDIWPLDSETSDFSDERAIYEAGGFEAGSFAFFEEADGSGLLLTGAHLFATPEGAAAALDVIEASFSDVDLVAAITGLPAGALTAVEQSDTGLLGDRDAAVVLTGDVFQVVGYVWITGNLLQFVRASMALGDPFREEAALLVAFGMADRTGG